MHATAQSCPSKVLPLPPPSQNLATSAQALHGPGPSFVFPLRVPLTKPREFIIHGTTRSGRQFRPSDWAERLAGALSSFRPGGVPGGQGAHIGYSPYCVPRLVDDNRCVLVSEALRSLEPMAWDFAMNFARDNDLKVVEVGVEESPQADPIRLPPTEADK